MRIARVATAVVQANFDYTFVRIYTDDGLFGTGECFMAPGITAIVRDLGEILTGCDPRDVMPCHARLMTAVSAAGGLSTAGIAYNAVSGLEAALWDLYGKVVGQPVSRLLGGAYRDCVDVYIDLHAGGKLESLDRVMRYREPFWLADSGETTVGVFYWDAVEKEAPVVEAAIERGRAAVAAGYRKMKFDLDVFGHERGPFDRSMRRTDVARIAEQAVALREALGDDIDIAFDCHWRFDVPTALAIANAIAPARPMWLEDPVPPDPSALARVAHSSPVPIATGENTYLVEGFQQLIDSGSAQILTPDLQKAGGLLEGVKIADAGARRFLPVAPHCIASPLGFLATIHACAASTNVSSVEFHGGDVPFWSELVDFPEPLIHAGQVRVPTGPGVGVELNLDVVERYAAPGEPVFDGVAVR